jgi:hypothetical protein
MGNVLSYELDKTAEWRSRKAERHPEDVRNADAVERLKALSAMGVTAELAGSYDMLSEEVSPDRLGDVHSSVLGAIGFGFMPDSIDEVLTRINDLLSDDT